MKYELYAGKNEEGEGNELDHNELDFGDRGQILKRHVHLRVPREIGIGNRKSLTQQTLKRGEKSLKFSSNLDIKLIPSAISCFFNRLRPHFGFELWRLGNVNHACARQSTITGTPSSAIRTAPRHLSTH